MLTTPSNLYQLLSDEVCEINLKSRTINIPSSKTFVGVENDTDVNALAFKLESSFNGTSLEDFTFFVNYINANAERDSYEVTDAALVDGEITFTWTLSRKATSYRGNLSFVICAKKFDADGNIVKSINTTVCSVKVLKGIEASTHIAQQYADLMEQWKNDILSSFEDGIDEAVSNYLEENPVQAYDDSEIKQSITEINEKVEPIDVGDDYDGFVVKDSSGNVGVQLGSKKVWDIEPYNKKYGFGGYPYGTGVLPPYSRIAGIFESDMFSVRGGRGRWNKEDTGNLEHGGHLFEGWNAEEDARLTFGIGTTQKDIAWIQTFHAAEVEGSDTGAYYGVTKVGSDIDRKGIDFMPTVTKSQSIFCLKVGNDLTPSATEVQKLVDTGELVNWEYNSTDMVPYGAMYYDYDADKVRVYTKTGWKYLAFE